MEIVAKCPVTGEDVSSDPVIKRATTPTILECPSCSELHEWNPMSMLLSEADDEVKRKGAPMPRLHW